MTQDELLTLVAEKVSEITGETYVVDYLPHRNLSDQPSKTYRCVSPGAMTFDNQWRTTTPMLYQSVAINIFETPLETEIPETIKKYQNEITLVLQKMASRGNAISLSDGKYRATVVAGESTIPFDSGVSLAAVMDDPAICIASLSLMFLIA